MQNVEIDLDKLADTSILNKAKKRIYGNDPLDSIGAAKL